MKRLLILLISTLFAVNLGFAQQAENTEKTTQDKKISFFRSPSQTGIHVFETTKDDINEFTGIKVRVGGNFTQQFQALNHQNNANMKKVSEEDPRDLNQLVDIHNGFNLATANLNLDVQLAEGIRLHMVTYLSARHHTEAWVKGGYIQFDRLPFDLEPLNKMMDYVTVKIGHMEINYGDAHFRRTDNGNALYNPFVGNYIMDAFDTQIGSEVYFQKDGFLAMGAITSGEIKNDITGNAEEAPNNPAVYGKIGYDKKVNNNLRLRLTGSFYHTSDMSNTNHLYDGDRGGSRYYHALQPAYVRDWRSGQIRPASEGSDFRTGRHSPGFSQRVTAFMVNPFVKVGGFELFGTYETAIGGRGYEVEAATDTDGNVDMSQLRKWDQIAVEGIYRFFPKENLYLGYRFNTVNDARMEDDPMRITRNQIGLGWFLTPNILLKSEYVMQKYLNFSADDYRSEGQFDGFMIEAVVGF